MVIAIFDVDGTLVDSVKSHAAAWQDVLREFGHAVPFNDIRQQIGKGSDELLKAFLKPDEIERFGQSYRRPARRDLQAQLHEARPPVPPCSRGVPAVQERRIQDRTGTSAKAEELQGYLKLLNIDDLIDAKTSADDADKSKPHPDIFQAALGKIPGAKPQDAIVIGDTPYDAEAAVRGGMKPIGVLYRRLFRAAASRGGLR